MDSNINIPVSGSVIIPTETPVIIPVEGSVIIPTKDSLQWWDYYFNNQGYYTVLFQIVLTVVLGIILSIFSVGLFIYIFFYFLFELMYANRRGFRYTPDEAITRLSIFLWGLVGFLFGRYAIGDGNPFRSHYDVWDYSSK